MKTLLHALTPCLLAAFSLLAFACEDDSDNTQPVIDLVEPEDGDTLHIGGDVHFEAIFSDNEALGSYKIDIHNNFDNHGHALVTRADEATVNFTFNRSYDIGNNNPYEAHHHDIVIPENATPGNYHLVLYCTDKAGNEERVAINVVLSHEGGEDHDHDD
jgi:hypothetical protein